MSGMDRLTDEALANVAALLRDDLYMQQCDGLSALLKTAKQAASAIDELLSKRKLRYMGKIHGVDTFVATDAAHRRASQAAPAPSDGLREALERIGWHDLTAIEARDVARAALPQNGGAA